MPPEDVDKPQPDIVDAVVEGPDLNPSRSPFDKKVYRQVLLPNGLRCVLISDTLAMTQAFNSGGLFPDDDDNDDDDNEKEDGEHDDDDDDNDSSSEDAAGGLRNAAAAMLVGVGSLYDPVECGGMAHFLEHLLFMGSQKYPEENAYDAFMSKHGGNDNAYTEMEHTVYHFEIPQEHLAGALDIFAQFFIAPLMLESSVERELQAIDSEFQLVKNSDNTRVQHLMSHTCGRTPFEHPVAKFGWGNYRSLKEIPESQGVDPLKMLHDFYDKVCGFHMSCLRFYPCKCRNESILD
jgi:nardilysin